MLTSFSTQRKVRSETCLLLIEVSFSFSPASSLASATRRQDSRCRANVSLASPLLCANLFVYAEYISLKFSSAATLFNVAHLKISIPAKLGEMCEWCDGFQSLASTGCVWCAVSWAQTLLAQGLTRAALAALSTGQETVLLQRHNRLNNTAAKPSGFFGYSSKAVSFRA